MDKYDGLLLLAVLCVTVAFFGVTVYHELAHVRVYSNYGCDNISVWFSLENLTAYTGAECEVLSPDMVYLNTLNEIIGYHLFSVLAVAVIMFVVWALFKIIQMRVTENGTAGF